MQENRFFQGVWRVNGIAILLVLIFVLGMGGFTVVKEIFHRDRPTVITNIAQDPQGEEKWTLGSSNEIEGTDSLYIPLVSEKKDISVPVPAMSKGLHSYGGTYFSPSRNILFVNKITGDMRWLFKGNGQLVSHIELLSVLKRYDKDRKIDAIVYQVITHDTDGNSKLDLEDKADVALSLPDGTRFKQVIKSVERIFGTISIGGQEVLVLYQADGKGFAATVRLADMSVLTTKEMPKVEQAP